MKKYRMKHSLDIFSHLMNGWININLTFLNNFIKIKKYTILVWIMYAK